ncbi:MAG: class I SAM-dependent RNA methyltransferase [Spirochaetaceae bacterium]|jgi:23S rRNA (uracil1939-C5)-methyltransferase|nr:class I SAM-dependent RNA methyltransferase [Spirochaetaceae bacterium]
MASDSVFRTQVSGLSAKAEGIVIHEGSLYFIEGVVPGDEVVCKITSGETRTKNAELINIEKVSPFRTEAPCSFFGRCGGCSLQHISYNAQLFEKEKILRSALSRMTGIEEIPPIEINPSSPFEYRERFQFHRVELEKHREHPSGHKQSGLSAPLNAAAPRQRDLCGFATHRSHDIIPVNDCMIASKIIRDALQSGMIKPPLDKNRWTVYGRETTLLQEGGKERGKIYMHGKEIYLDAALFFQSNSALLEKLIERIIVIAEGAEKKSRAGDFYCGVGTFAVFLRDIFPELDLLEENTASLALARENLTRTQHGGQANKGIRFFPMTDNQWVKSGKHESYAFLVVDPSRQGLSSLMRQWLCQHKPDILAYVSCEPFALARDAKELLSAGFYLDSLTLYDFYPQTTHIETLAVFRKSAP